jgi:olfactory receptor
LLTSASPKADVHLHSKDAGEQTYSKMITCEACITQVYFFILFGVLDNFLLAVMAYDCFVAICDPLHYTIVINLQLCGFLVLVPWVITALNSLL